MNNDCILWHGIIAGVPYDGEPMQEVVMVHPVLTILVVVLTTAGTIFGIACMIFNFVYRNKRLDDDDYATILLRSEYKT